MKNLFIYLLLIAVFAVSCFKEAELGYPASVTFSSDGGVRLITGDMDFSHATIQNYKTGDGSSYIMTEDERYSESVEQLELDWLRVEYGRENGNEIKIYAEPNTTGKQRTLHVELYSAYDYDVVRVTQQK